jgi:alpha-galactosidase
MNERIVLVGAGSAMFTRGLVADLIQRGEPAELRLVDIDAGALEVAEGLARKMAALRGAPVVVRADTDRRQLLPGATAVICTVGVGGRRAWEQDVFVPREYGIFQPVGDTVMPGGTSRALRMVPAMVCIAEDVMDLAPDALFFNYGNPMAVVCRAVRQATQAPMVGLCHGVHDVGRYLAGELGVPLDRFDYAAVGMNHLTWFVEASVDGEDVMPALECVAQNKEEALARRLDAAAQEGTRPDVSDLHPFSWQLLRRFGGFPAALDRHVTEFFPQFFADGEYYGRTLGVDAYSFEDTIARGDAIYEEMREAALSDEPLPGDYFRRIGGEHEQVLDIIASIRSDSREIYSVNLPNNGQVPNLPEDAIVESPAVATAAGLVPLAQPPLPSGIVGTLATRLAWVDTVAEAALRGSRRHFIQALVLDGAVSSLQEAENLADDLLQAQAAHLPQFA